MSPLEVRIFSEPKILYYSSNFILQFALEIGTLYWNVSILDLPTLF
jgi:hypothetical protein